MNQRFWKDKRVLITGHTGFKGSWLTLLLSHLGAKISGISIDIPTSPSFFNKTDFGQFLAHDFRIDIRNRDNLKPALFEVNPEIIFHLAAQPLVKDSYTNPIYTYEVNVMGTMNLLMESLALENLKAIINITTDKCYQNIEKEYAYKEEDKLGGLDPYSSSKACSEILTQSLNHSFFEQKGIILATARAGNVIGGGDWAKDRIIPDLMRAHQESKTLIIRNPKSIRPWQHVLEPLIGYLQLTEHLVDHPNSYRQWNFGPNLDSCIQVGEIVELIKKSILVETDIQKTLPLVHEAKLLMLNNDRARKHVGWKPILTISEALDWTTDWYKSFFKGSDIMSVSFKQIEQYLERLK